MNPISSQRLREQLQSIGIQQGDVLIVHVAFSLIAPIEGGPMSLINALGSVLGDDGTLVMPSMSDDDDTSFDPKQSPCAGMGIVAETFWKLPNVLRSDSPHAFAARGPFAPQITAPHPIEPPHGLHSPVGRVYEMDGKILLLGVGHEANTTIHLAENLAGVRYRQDKYITLNENGRHTRFDYSEIDHCCENFSLVDGWLDEASLQRHGIVGNGSARLAKSQDIVNVVLKRLNRNETIFLHDTGTCDDCDAAWHSLDQQKPPSLH